jgi:dihydrodipicolinate reductase
VPRLSVVARQRSHVYRSFTEETQMLSIVAGDGGMGRAVASALAGRGTPTLAILGMPDSPAGHSPEIFRGADVLFEFTVGDQVLQNVRAALDGGVRRFVIGTTDWAEDRPRLRASCSSAEPRPWRRPASAWA